MSKKRLYTVSVILRSLDLQTQQEYTQDVRYWSFTNEREALKHTRSLRRYVSKLNLREYLTITCIDSELL